MLNNPAPLSAAQNERRRVWPRAALAAMMLMPFAGCASKPSTAWSTDSQHKRTPRTNRPSTGWSTDSQHKQTPGTNSQYRQTFKQIPSVDQTRTYGQTASAQEYFTEKAKNNKLPEKYLSEARIGMTEVDTKLAEARATEIERNATVRKESARIKNKRVNAAAQEETELAELDRLKKEQEAMQAELVAQLTAHERQAKATVAKNARMAEALAKEQRTVQQDLISQAEKDFNESRAQIEELRVIRLATEKEGAAAIEQARKNAQATRTRAAATVDALRQEAQTATNKTTARVAELCTRLATIPKQFQAKATQLKTKATSVEDQARAKAAELQARATAMEKQSAEHKYNLMVSVTKTERQQAQIEAERKSVESRTAYERAAIGVEQLRGDAHLTIQSAQSESTRQFGELNAWFKRSKADIDRLRSAADRLEKFARAEFVKALARHAADAVRETNEHQEVLSEAQMKTTIAEVEAKAAIVHEHLMNELERQTQAGKVDLPGKTAATNESMNLEVVSSPKVAAVAKSIDPDTIAAFRSTLAKVVHDRISAGAQFSSLEASYNEQKTNIDSVRDQRIAVGNEQLATADAVHLHAVAGLAESNANITAELAAARSGHDRSMVEAETFRRRTLADVAELRALAKGTLDDAAARTQALRKEAQATMENGQSEVDAIQASLRSTEEQGEAVASRLLAEAHSVEQSEAALAEQIDAQINAADQELVAELANLDRQIESSTAIAETNYKEMLAQAEAIGLQAEMDIKRLAARNDLEKAIAQSEVERLHDLHFVNSMKGEAEVERRLATALAKRTNSDAASDAEQVAIGAHADIATAAVEAQRRIAAARANMVKSLFNTRLVEVDAERVKRKAEALVTGSRERANAETILSKAKASREKTKERMARLVSHQESLQRAAVKDWDSRLSKNPPVEPK